MKDETFIRIPRGFPLYAFVPEWTVFLFWVVLFALYMSSDTLAQTGIIKCQLSEK